LLGCNKIALGHHYDDVIETTLMGMLWGGQFQAMVPKINSLNFEGMELIRPMYLIREDDIKSWRNTNNLYFIQCACKFTEQNYDINKNEKTESKRLETKNLIKQLKQTNPNIEKNIFSSTKNVNLYTLLGYKVGEKVVDFKDIFEEQKKNNMKLFNSDNDRKDQ
nr:ATPase [Clostridia bacterium]